MSENNVSIEGRVVRDPQCRTVGNYTIAEFSIAYNKNKKKADGTWDKQAHFFEVKAWNKLAQNAQKSLKKGMLIRIDGELIQESWNDKKTQEKVYKTVIMARAISIPLGNAESEPQAPTQQPDFMQSPQDNPPPEHQLPPKRTQEDDGEGHVVYSSERDNPRRREPVATPVANEGPWTPPEGGEPPF